MAKKRNGPYVAVAAFCKELLRERNEEFGSIIYSPIRIFDEVVLEGPKVSGPVAVVPLKLTGLLMLRGGGLEGDHRLTVRVDLPDIPGVNPSQPRIEHRQKLTFQPGSSGIDCQISFELQLPAPLQGTLTYLFDVLLDRRFLTTMPLRLRYRVRASSQAGEAADDTASAAVADP